MSHHSKRELIAPEVSAQPVVRDMNVHKVPLLALTRPYFIDSVR
jgi:hypothetical protein